MAFAVVTADEQTGTQGPRTDPSALQDRVASLLRRLKLSGREWAVVLTVLLSSTPLTAREIATRTRLAYSHAKAVTRGLLAWHVLERRPEGLVFQPDATRWRAPAHAGSSKPPLGQRPAAPR